MIARIRRYLALRRMHRRIDANLARYGEPEDFIVRWAQEDLARIVEARRNSPEIVRYRERRAAALKGRT